MKYFNGLDGVFELDTQTTELLPGCPAFRVSIFDLYPLGTRIKELPKAGNCGFEDSIYLILVRHAYRANKGRE